MENVVQWLDSIGSRAFSLSMTLFVLLNGAAVVAIAIRRDREMVNRWTPRILAANLMLVGTGLGVPLAALMVRTAVQALAPAATALSAPANRSAPIPESAREISRP